jgi:hypothetical protein
MNSISNNLPGFSQEMGNLQDTRFSGHSRKQSVNAYESLDAGLTIKTREGDIVTLSSNSFSEFNSSEYNSKGEIRTDSGSAQFSRHNQQITLTTGEQFSFSVQGDLNEQELADIGAIVKGVDSIAEEMASGDMKGAVEKAMSMGNYSSVSMYSAEITHKRSYSVAQEARSVSNDSLGAQAMGRKGHAAPKALDNFTDKMASFLENQDDKLLAKAQKPLSKLFEQLLKNQEALEKAGQSGESDKAKRIDTPVYGMLKAAGKQVDQMIDDMLNNAFGKNLSNFV